MGCWSVNRKIVAAGCYLLSVSPAFALGDCVLNISAAAFGAYDMGMVQALTTQGRVEVVCDVPVLMSIQADTGQAGGYRPRRMLSAGPDALVYNLYLDTLYSVVWGNGADHSRSWRGLVPAGGWVLPFFGHIPARQNVAPGVYRDTVVITVEY